MTKTRFNISTENAVIKELSRALVRMTKKKMLHGYTHIPHRPVKRIEERVSYRKRGCADPRLHETQEFFISDINTSVSLHTPSHNIFLHEVTRHPEWRNLLYKLNILHSSDESLSSANDVCRGFCFYTRTRTPGAFRTHKQMAWMCWTPSRSVRFLIKGWRFRCVFIPLKPKLRPSCDILHN